MHKKSSLLRNLRVTWQEVDLVELIVHGIKETHVRDSAMARDCRNVSELLVYLSSFAKRVRDESIESNSCDRSFKRPKLQEPIRNKNSVRCHNCGKTGHIRRQCRLSSQKSNTVGQQKSEHISVQNIPKSVCSFCAKTGHSVENCFTKNAIEQRRKINFCTLFQSVVPTDVDVDGNKFQGLIDTGADVSLISDKHQSLFADKIQSCSIVIRGITQGSIEINKLFCRR